jgi:putative aldouronate transport system substrate-binding protein
MLMPPVPQDIETISTQIGDVLKTNCWKMVFAANEAEFEALWRDAQQKAEVLGIQKILDWARNAWTTAQAEAADYR